MEVLQTVHSYLKQLPIDAHEGLGIFAWVLAGLVFFATVCPESLRPHVAEPEAERFFAYLITGFVFALAYPDYPLIAGVLIVVAAVVLELLQHIIPGRFSSFKDAREGAFGGLLGVTLGGILYRLTIPFWHAHGM